MALAEMNEGSAPRVEAFQGKLAVYGNEGEEAHGFLLSAAQASTVALRLLAAVARSDRAVLHRAESLEIDVADTTPEAIVRITLTIDGLPIAVELDPTRFAELGAAVADISREIDRAKKPRRDL